MLVEPLTPAEAKALIRQIVANGTVAYSTHCKDQMRARNVTMLDVQNVLLGGIVDPAENENGSWRYRVRTMKFIVVVAFRSETSIVLVTTMRIP